MVRDFASNSLPRRAVPSDVPKREILVKTDLLFDRCNLTRLDLNEVRAHGGEGLIRFARVADRSALLGGCNFIDIAELPPGTSIGSHTHAGSEEELYLVLAGTGQMSRNGETFPVKSGDLIRNPPGGTHSLRNTGSETLRIFVFELEIHP
jgi:mannose-6-phosphate isomerase-like protein (cupin superfamily)